MGCGSIRFQLSLDSLMASLAPIISGLIEAKEMADAIEKSITPNLPSA